MEPSLKNSVLHRYVSQMWALLMKDYILWKRNWKSSIVLLFAPFFFVVLYGIVAAATNSSSIDLHPRPILTLSGSSSPIPKCLVFDAKGGRYGQGKVIPDAKCVSLVYTPNTNAEVVNIMSLVAKKNGFSHSKDGPSGTSSIDLYAETADVIGFPSVRELSSFVTATGRGRAGAAIVFNDTVANSAQLPNAIYYDIWYNKSTVGAWMSGAGKDLLFKQTSVSSFTLNVQRGVHEAVLAARAAATNGGTPDSSRFELSLRQFPQVPSVDGRAQASASVNTFAGLFYYCAIMFTFIVSLTQVVAEKESNLLAHMRTMGLFESAYWLSWLLYFSIIMMVAAILVYIGGLICQLPFFTGTNGGVIIVSFFLYGVSMECLALLLSSFIGRVKIANTVGFLLFALGLIVQLVLSSSGTFLTYLFYDDLLISKDWQRLINLYPPIQFAKIYADVNELTKATLVTTNNITVETYGTYSWDMLYDQTASYVVANRSSLNCPTGWPVADCYYRIPTTSASLDWMAITCVIFLVLAWYLSQVFPGEHGRAQRPWFIVDPRYWIPAQYLPRFQPVPFQPLFDSSVDEDVKDFVQQMQGAPGEYAVRIEGLVKKYGQFRAVNGLSVGMRRGEVFALLGHNGAGKTSAIKVVTGMTRATGGDAILSGFSIGTDMDAIRQFMGVCPQHDILWDDLTAREHLWLTGKFKGLGGRELDQLIISSLEDVKLGRVVDVPAGRYSGGMKRRLSVAISAMASPDVVLLDEPTTGMDPMNRKHVWDMIRKLKTKCAVILTTHSMEEADALGDAIGIMSHGRLIAVGTSLRLKNKFGGGYQVKLVTPEMTTVKESVSRLMPGAQLVDDSAGSLSYSLPRAATDQLVPMFRWLESEGAKANDVPLLTDWGLSQTTLEEVFIRLSRKEEEEFNVSKTALNSPSAAAAVVPNDASSAAAHDTKIDDPQKKLQTQVLGGDLEAGAAGAVRVMTPRQQVAALYRKTAELQRKQTATLCSQICCPVFLLIIVWLLQYFVIDPLNSRLDQANSDVRTSLTNQCDSCVRNSNVTCFATLGAAISGGTASNISNPFFYCSTCMPCVAALNASCQSGNQPFICSAAPAFLSAWCALPTPRNCFGPEFNAVVENKCTPLYAPAGAGCSVPFPTNPICSCSQSPFYDAYVRSSCPACRLLDQQFSSQDVYDPSFAPKTFQDGVGMLYPPGSIVSGPVAVRVLVSTEAGLENSVGFKSGGVLSTVISPSLGSLALRAVCPLTFAGSSGSYFPTLCETQTLNMSTLVTLETQRRALAAAGMMAAFPQQLAQRSTSESSSSSGSASSSNQTVLPFQGIPASTIQSVTYFASPSIDFVASPDSADVQVFNAQNRARDQIALSSAEQGSALDLAAQLFPAAALHFRQYNKATASATVDLTSYFAQTSVGNRGSNAFAYVRILFDKAAGWPTRLTNCGSGPGCFSSAGLSRFADAIPTWNYISNGNTNPEIRVHHATVNMLATAMLRDSVNNNSTSVTAGFSPFPYRNVGNTLRFDPEALFILVLDLMVPLATSFLLPVFLFQIVVEKELRLRAMMIMMGLQMKFYWLVMAAFNFTMHFILMFVVMAVAYICSISLFTGSEFILILVVLFMWGLAEIPLAFFLSALFNRTRQSTIWGYLIVIISVIVSLILNLYTFSSTDMPSILLLWPPFAFYRCIHLLGGRSFYFRDLSAGEEMSRCLLFLLLDAALYSLLAAYADAVTPKTYGVSLSPLFCFKPLRRLGRKLPVGADSQPPVPPDSVVNSSIDRPLSEIAEDEDVTAERNAVRNRSIPQGSPVIVDGLQKIYPGGKVAVKELTFHIPNGECFGLLGPNGAGKTTCISVLTGLYAQSAGNASIVGLDITKNMNDIYRIMGMCPQFDVIWPDLTVRQHLRFYSRLKGGNPALEKAAIVSAAQNVQLEDVLDREAKRLSGGMRRRLSLAISLMGEPQVVFLDEPTTGLDPETRRHVWQLIDRVKSGKVIILTTHSMDEADALCGRIGIMAHGRLRCIGTNLRLKNKFGSGYKVELLVSETVAKGSPTSPRIGGPASAGDVKVEDITDSITLPLLDDSAHRFVMDLMPSAVLESSSGCSRMYQVPRDGIIVSKVFESMNHRPDVGIVDWGLRQTSLEEVFLKIAEESEHNGSSIGNN